MDFETIGLKGKFRDLTGDPSVGFTAMVFGQPKAVKSTLMLEFAKHLASNYGKILYVAVEEGYTQRENSSCWGGSFGLTFCRRTT